MALSLSKSVSGSLIIFLAWSVSAILSALLMPATLSNKIFIKPLSPNILAACSAIPVNKPVLAPILPPSAFFGLKGMTFSSCTIWSSSSMFLPKLSGSAINSSMRILSACFCLTLLVAFLKLSDISSIDISLAFLLSPDLPKGNISSSATSS